MVTLTLAMVFVALAADHPPGKLPDLPDVGLLPIPSPPLLGKKTVSTYPYHVTRPPARHQLDKLVTTVRLYRVLIEDGQWDVNSAFNILQVYCQVAAEAADVFGETAELIPWYEARLAAVKWVEAVAARGLATRTLRRSDVSDDLPSGKLRERVERPLVELKARLGR
jgi:hypothetical protein